MMEWQPIESAPKDGTTVLAIVSNNPGRLLEYQAGRVFSISHAGITECGYDLGWNVYPGLGGCGDNSFTHWMPLPPPPK